MVEGQRLFIRVTFRMPCKETMDLGQGTKFWAESFGRVEIEDRIFSKQEIFHVRMLRRVTTSGLGTYGGKIITAVIIWCTRNRFKVFDCTRHDSEHL